MMDLKRRLRALMRFPASRWVAACVIAAVLSWLTRVACSAPPTNFAVWPPEAKSAAGGLVSGGLALCSVAWAALAATWSRRFLWGWPRRVGVGLALLLGARWLTAGLIALAGGVSAMTMLPPPGAVRVAQAAAVVVLPQAVIGVVPLTVLAVFERLYTWFPSLRRLLESGTGARGGFMSTERMKHYLHDLPGRVR